MTPLANPIPAPPRILLVTRHFWPHAAGRHDAAAQAWRLTRLWSAAGWTVEVATVRYGADWPTDMWLGSVRVHRIAAAPRGSWASSRYVRFLGQFIQHNISRFDAVVVDAMRDDVPAITSLVAMPESPVQRLVMAGGYETDGDVHWCRYNRGGKRSLQAIATAAGVVTNGPSIDRFLISEKTDPRLLVRIARGVERKRPPSPQRKLEARRTLFEINSDLRTHPDDVVLLWCGSMQANSSMNRLVSGSWQLIQKFPRLKIWLVGDGPQREWLHQELRSEGIRGSVSMPGSFPDMTEVLDSVDLVWQTDDAQLRETVWMSMEHPLPVVLADVASVRECLAIGKEDPLAAAVNWYDPGKKSSETACLAHVIGHLDEARDRAMVLAQGLAQRQPRSKELDQWSSLFRARPTDTFLEHLHRS